MGDTLPSTMAALETSAALGRQLAALMDTETPVEGVTSGSVRDALKSIARPERLDNVVDKAEVVGNWGRGRERTNG